MSDNNQNTGNKDSGEGTNELVRLRGAVESATQKAQEYEAKFVDLEKKWKGLDPEKVKADLSELHRRMAKSGDDQDLEKIREEIEGSVRDRVKSLESENSALKSTVKKLRVTNEAMKHHSEFFVEKSEAEIESLVERHLDYDEKTNSIIVKDEKGEARYSKTNAGNKMDVKEFFTQISQDRPYLAKAKGKGGNMSDSTGRALPPGSSPWGKLPAMNGSSQEQIKTLTEFFKANPTALQELSKGNFQ